MKLIVMNEGVDFEVKDKNDAIDAILEEYHRFDLSMAELLDSLELRGFSIQDTVDIFSKVIYKTDSDKTYIESEGEHISRWDW